MSSDVEPRLVSIETAVAHLQHDVEQFHRVLLDVQGEVRTLKLAFDKLVARMDQMAQPPEIRDLEAERPPHY